LGIFFLLFAILAACSSLPVETPLPTFTSITPTNSATAYLGPTPAITIAPTIFTSQVISTPISIKPEMEIIAPDKREVELAELGLSDSTRLILYY
jgi:hypothetical protein